MAVERTVLAVDDEPGILKLIELSLPSYRVVVTDDGQKALELAEKLRPDVIILDLIMPGMDGFELMSQLRERTNVPIILLSAKAHDEDKVRGLELGADDYLVKPFNPGELAARVEAVLRRGLRSAAASGPSNVVKAGNVEIDLEHRLVKKDGASVRLTRTEWMLLEHLAINAGTVMLNTDLLTQIWGPEYTDDLQYLRVWMSRLRSKLETDPAKPEILRTLQGLGYLLDTDGRLRDQPRVASDD